MRRDKIKDLFYDFGSKPGHFFRWRVATRHNGSDFKVIHVNIGKILFLIELMRFYAHV